MNADDREFAAAILRQEGNRWINRIQPGDPECFRETVIQAAHRCDDVVSRLLSHECEADLGVSREQAAREEADARAAGIFHALVSVAASCLAEYQAGTSPSALGAVGDIDTLLLGLRENLEGMLAPDTGA